MKLEVANYNMDPVEETFRYPINITAPDLPPLPPPLEVMRDYIRAHSVEALRRDPHPERRRVAIAFYQCPLQAGNRLHHFWNGLLWSVLTNRTVLWKYWDNATCHRYGSQFNLEICKTANTAEDCAQVLVRAPWMASYDEWKDILSLSDDEPFVIPYHATMGRVWDDEERFPLPANYEQSFGVDLDSKYTQRVVVFPVCHFKFWQLADPALRRTLLKTRPAQEAAAKLYSYGADFLFGMLHRFTFDFASALRNSIPAATQNNSLYYTIGLHSRHRYRDQDGCNIDQETACLQEIFARRVETEKPIRVSLMSDRTCTIDRLVLWLEPTNTSVLTFHHQDPSPDYLREHGPYAGIGFFYDLALVTTARSALIGMTRSSSDLVRELIVFYRTMEVWEALGATLRGSEIDSCVLSNSPR